MKRVYEYLLQKRHIDREILSYFAKVGTIYESVEHHNIVFAGLDSEGKIRHIHVKGSCSDGRSFRLNQEGSEAAYGFGYRGTGNRLYVFEAPIDLLSFLSLYPDNWQENSYITLNGVAEHAMLQALKDNPRLDTVVLCLDHDPAGIEACGRLSEILVRNGYGAVKRLQSACKDWNEDLKGRYGEETNPAQEHPRVMECRAWTEVLKEVTESINVKYANRSYICRYYQDIYNELKKGRGMEQLTDAFDWLGMLLTGVLVRCMEKEGIALGRETSAGQILENLSKRYQPHKDKGNFNTRIRQMQAAFEETLEVFDTKDLEQKENQELLARKCMSLAMECIRAHIIELNKNGIPFESHIYAYGGHSYSIGERLLRIYPATDRMLEWVPDSLGWLDDTLGKITKEGFTQPNPAVQKCGDTKEMLSVDCTFKHMCKQSEEAKNVLKSLFDFVDVLVAEKNSTREGFADAIGNPRVRDLLLTIKVPEAAINQMNDALAQIENQR